GPFLKNYRERRLDLTKLARAGKDECGSHVRMAGKWNLSGGRKDSDVTGVAGFCGKHESAFGEVELACDLLHLMIRKAVCLGEHGQRIPAEARLCKHIRSVVSIFHESGKVVDSPNPVRSLMCVLRRDDLAQMIS